MIVQELIITNENPVNRVKITFKVNDDNVVLCDCEPQFVNRNLLKKTVLNWYTDELQTASQTNVELVIEIKDE